MSERWNTMLAQEVRMLDYAVFLELQSTKPRLDDLLLQDSFRRKAQRHW